jgi:ferredoxin
VSGIRYDLVLDPTACDGKGICAELLPECVRLDPWGFPVIDGDGVPPHLVDHAQRAVASCPRLALTLVKRSRSSVSGRSTG